MGNYYIIAAGGTGAMCARAFIYMAAAGCADNNATYHILLMDKDKESDAMTACESLLEDYIAMRDQLGTKPDTQAFPQIVVHKWNFTDHIVDEYQKQTGNPAATLKSLTLNKLLNPRKDPKMAQLLATMYTQDELDTDLNQGFYGHPNIGAPVFDYVQDRFLAKKVIRADGSSEVNTFMTSLHDSLRTEKAYVYLMGSLFGGTGATVLPNVVRALRSMHDPSNPANCYGQTSLILGGSVIMPYFRLPSCPPDSLEATEKVSPVDSKFAGQTREALSYYDESGLLSNMMNLMLLGTSQMDVTSEMFSRGGRQTQHFHLVLLLAAVAANRFFANKLGNMVSAVNDTAVKPLGELLLWKTIPNDSANAGIYQTLTPEELDLDEEYANLMAFLRFSVVVGYYMRLKFDKRSEDLKHIVEVLGTAQKMKGDNGRPLNPKSLSNQDIQRCYKDPVGKAGAICRGFIQFMYDISLTGYDWSQYRVLRHDENPTVVDDGKNYYSYYLGEVVENAAANFSQRWVDFANLTSLKVLLEAQSPSEVIDQMTLNSISSHERLDNDQRPEYEETRFDHSIATVYERDAMKNLGLEKNFFGKIRRDEVWFCEIYDQLLKLCK